MKSITAFCAILAVGIGAHLIVAQTSAMNNNAPVNETVEPVINTSHDGMFFDVQEVVETLGYNETVWYMVYDDPDAGMDYEIIRIDKRTHDTIVKAQKRHQPLTGTLKITKPYESVEYVLEADEYHILTQYASLSLK